MKERVAWVDNVKFICMMFVMVSHLESHTASMFHIYGPFFLMGFFFVSGYVYKAGQAFRPFFVKKVKGLLVPWAIFSFLLIFMSAVMSFNKHMSLREEILWNCLQIRGKWDGLWFVAALFVAYIPFYFAIKYVKENWLLPLAAVLWLISKIYDQYMDPQLLPWKSTALPWHVEYIFIAMFFMVLGYLYKQKYEQKYDRMSLKLLIPITMVYLIVVLTVFYLKLDFGRLGTILYDLITQLVGVAIVVNLAKRIPYNRLVQYIGQNTIIYFALHGKVLSLFEQVLAVSLGGFYIKLLHNNFISGITSVVIAIVIAIALLIPTYIINRWFPFCVGRKRQNRK